MSEKTLPKIESKEELILRLRSTIQNVKTEPSPKRKSRNRRCNKIVPYDSVVTNLQNIHAWIKTAHQFLKETEDADLRLSYASEWLMDNYYLVSRTIRQVKKDISEGFYDDLPKVEGGQQDGHARIFVFAANTLSHQDLLFDSAFFEQILIDLQHEVPLETGEIWALPIFLRITLLEFLADTLYKLIRPAQTPTFPAPGRLISAPDTTPYTTDETEDMGNRVANIIHSIRIISELDWNDFLSR